MKRAPNRLRGRPRAGAGFFNPVYPSATQVLGEAGVAYLSRLTPGQRAALPKKLAAKGTTTLIVATGGELADPHRWIAAGITVKRRAEPAHDITHALRREQAERGAKRTTVHGVLLEIHGLGLLIEGAPGSGKSALALELISRGHALVADDAVEIERPARGVLVGRCPGVIGGYLEARGLGIVDMRELHGERALRDRTRLELILRLAPGRPRALKAHERLAGRRSTRRILGESVPVLSLPQTGHNLAALAEAACLDRRLQLDGVNAPAALARRQARAIRKGK